MKGIIKTLKDIISSKSLQNIPLMDRPSDEEIKRDPYTSYYKLDEVNTDIFLGANIHSETYGSNRDTWRYPEGVEEKIKPDKNYKIWYRCHDASDPCDTSTFYYVYYIEEVPQSKIELINNLKKLIKELQ